MSKIFQNLNSIKERIKKAREKYRKGQEVELVAVSKTRTEQQIEEAIKAGQKVFGENRIEEAKEKWPALKEKYPEVKLHLIGHLQSKKAKEAVKLFDVIETLDSYKLAGILAKEMEKQNKKPEIFLQINIGEESQKSGIDPQEADEFIKRTAEEVALKISGLMCLPPKGEDPELYFALLTTIARRNGIKNISMGMSSDFEEAISLGATTVRVGSAIFN